MRSTKNTFHFQNYVKSIDDFFEMFVSKSICFAFLSLFSNHFADNGIASIEKWWNKIAQENGQNNVIHFA